MHVRASAPVFTLALLFAFVDVYSQVAYSYSLCHIQHKHTWMRPYFHIRSHPYFIVCLFTVNKRNAVHRNLQKYLHELLMFVSMFESIIRKFHHSNMILRLRCTSFLPTIRIYETYLLIFIVFISPLAVY